MHLPRTLIGGSEAEARALHCWFSVDRVARDAETTAWKRLARLRQAQWREARGFPMGTHPHAGGDASKPVGSRLALKFAMETGANFLSPGALAAVRARLSQPERFEMLRADRLWADLLSSMPLCFNLFGDLAGDRGVADRAVRQWWPDAPTGASTVRFEYSQGRRDPLFLGNQSAFDAAIELDIGGGALGLIGIETKYHEHALVEAAPKGATLARYLEVAERSGAFTEGWRERVIGTALQQIWQDHLLLLSMLQHPSRAWAWGRFVLIHPAANPSFARAAAAYRGVLRDTTTFEVRTFEELIATPGTLPDETRERLVERYF
ncbi:MAG: hypothetical protein ABW061_03140 [Polyangiaceae bacterium]